MYKCSKCHITKDIKAFTEGAGKGRRPSWCLECKQGLSLSWRQMNKEKIAAYRKAAYHKDKPRHIEYSRKSSLKRRYGISVTQYEELLKAQGSRCKICKTEKPSQKQHFSVDHCHKTGEIRGLLCDNCNHGLGKFKDNPILLQEAINYLQTAKTELKVGL